MSKYIKLEDAINTIEDKIAEYIPYLYGRYREIPLELRVALERLPTIEVSEDCISDCNACRFAGCSECDDCINGSQWVRMTREDEE